ncbi:NADH dehydrogenase (quinone) subunit D [Wolinella succinogenes]|uniref:NADH-quinone oxidoreductase subunit D n=1 Tax=Wolinella succinogenes (strain ATCC 29543 / DSM 1740 / CCUG 13145 / JCM 31913 / LMG 7466 / NCTC 11488 / FDC 602W) TaxID=273121 RepID=NUOD_WOLSU|nr:NADH dehydrogenase (quinone) subunit D [Wolinella succinogenes]Q7MA48.1 RecName: Full=NADH-quinone oxidoreductase subunit D; AltName: Full=NADH dehydrogenase I subunit D; AltName: Full=NDH-1 subunit D [Wolinella succinogenes DSM 1740]CAE09615.1 NADH OXIDOREDUCTASE I [Wolinella succinogenes]VEG81830.1 NADH-quinone oxidoreductase subunit D [Wolinella succinogenes]HCZ18268.1 NADH-quinone oxidoreductase subunit D [Helicobacter sp.]
MQIPNRLQPFYENLVFERHDNQMVINFGPQHPSAHGQLRLILELEGEKVTRAVPDVGYLHRGMEKMGENMIYNEFIPTTDRMDYIAASSNNHAFALTVEKLLGIEVPRRAKVIRMMIVELNRIISHLFWLATHALDVGAMSIFLYCFREREFAMDLMEDYCGARLTHSSIRIGGVPLDLPAGWLEKLKSFLEKMPENIALYEGLLSENRIWKMRLENVGIITPEMAKSWGCSGVALRGSGIQWDLRKEQPYELYDEVEFDIPVSDSGDSYGRYKLYMEEMRQTVKILHQLIEMYPSTSSEIMAHAPQYISAPKEQIMTQNYSLMQHFVLVTQGMRPPVGEVYCATESPKGELGFFIRSEGEPYPYRLKIRAPSFYHTGILQDLLPGGYIADVVTIIGNLNIVFGEIDR